jgi:hypothetical protein
LLPQPKYLPLLPDRFTLMTEEPLSPGDSIHSPLH